MSWSQKQHKFPPEVKKQLQFYVYLYSDPDTGKAIYVGKGKDDRCFAHLEAVGDSDKAKTIRKILDAGKEPAIDILAWGLTEREALAAERVAIDLLGIGSLTNRQKGHGARQGRTPVDQLIRRLSGETLTDADAEEMRKLGVLVIRLGLYSEGMSDMELYDLTRSAWKLNEERKEHIHYAFAVWKGRIMETYRVLGWFREGETMMDLSVEKEPPDPEHRFEFIGPCRPGTAPEVRGKGHERLFQKGLHRAVYVFSQRVKYRKFFLSSAVLDKKQNFDIMKENGQRQAKRRGQLHGNDETKAPMDASGDRACRAGVPAAAAFVCGAQAESAAGVRLYRV